MPELPLWKWLLGAACAFSIGVAKTGVPGFGILAVPLFVLTVDDARLSAAWLLPLLIAADCYAVIVYRKKAAANALFSLLPWVMAGMAAGAAVLVYPDAVIRPLAQAMQAGGDEKADDVIARALQVLRVEDEHLQEHRSEVAGKIDRALQQFARGECL